MPRPLYGRSDTAAVLGLEGRVGNGRSGKDRDAGGPVSWASGEVASPLRFGSREKNAVFMKSDQHFFFCRVTYRSRW